MRILISNDDGIHAPGIRVLAKYLAPLAELFIIAPDKERSAVSHAITIHDAIHTRKYYIDGEFFGYTTSGTPVDCVKLALCELMENPPDLVISGINQGANLGVDVLYSGTVSAAAEGALVNIPSIAVSLNSYSPEAYFESAGKAIINILEHKLYECLPGGTLLNVNVPNVPYEAIEGYRITTQGRTKYIEKYVKHTDPRGNDYFWLDGELDIANEEETADHKAVNNNYVSISPIKYEFTDYEHLSKLESSLSNALNKK